MHHLDFRESQSFGDFMEVNPLVTKSLLSRNRRRRSLRMAIVAPPSEARSEADQEPCTISGLSGDDRFGYIPSTMKNHSSDACHHQELDAIVDSDAVPFTGHSIDPDTWERIGFDCSLWNLGVEEAWKEYKDEFPIQAARLSRARVLLPSGGFCGPLVDDGGQDAALSATMYSVKAILKEIEVACNWWEVKRLRRWRHVSPRVKISPPLASGLHLRILSRRALLERQPALGPLSADWYVLYGDVITATITSAPKITPTDAVELINLVPCVRGKFNGDSNEPNPHSHHHQLLLRLASRGLSCKAHPSPLVGDDGRFFPPFDVHLKRPGTQKDWKQGQSRPKLLFAHQAFYCDAFCGRQGAEEAERELRKLQKWLCPHLRLDGRSNAIMVISGFVFRSYREHISPEREKDRLAARTARTMSDAPGPSSSGTSSASSVDPTDLTTTCKTIPYLTRSVAARSSLLYAVPRLTEYCVDTTPKYGGTFAVLHPVDFG